MRADKNNFLTSVFRNLMLKGVGIPASFLITLILARYMATDQYGIYVLLISVATVLASGPVRVYSVLLVREIASSLVTGAAGRVSGVLLYCIGIGLLSVFVIYQGGVVAMIFPGTSVNILTLFVSLLLCTVIIGASLRGLGNSSVGLFIEQVSRPVVQLIFLSIVYISLKPSADIPLDTAYNSLIACLVITVLGGIVILVKYLKASGSFVKPVISREWVIASTPILLVLGYVGGFSTQLPFLLLGKFSTATEVSQFKVAVSIASLIGVSLLAVNMALGPRLASLYAKNDLVGYEQSLRSACTLIIYMALPIAIIFVLFNEIFVLVLFGEKFQTAADILWICCFAQVINSFCGPVVLAFNMMKKESMNIAAVFLALLVGILFGYLLVPSYGAMGAAVVSVVTIFSWNVFLIIMLKVKFNIVCLPYLNPLKAWKQ